MREAFLSEWKAVELLGWCDPSACEPGRGRVITEDYEVADEPAFNAGFTLEFARNRERDAEPVTVAYPVTPGELGCELRLRVDAATGRPMTLVLSNDGGHGPNLYGDCFREVAELLAGLDRGLAGSDDRLRLGKGWSRGAGYARLMLVHGVACFHVIRKGVARGALPEPVVVGEEDGYEVAVYRHDGVVVAIDGWLTSEESYYLRIDIRNKPLFDRYGEDHPAVRFLLLLFAFRCECVGCEIAWRGREDEAVECAWYSPSMRRMYRLSDVLYGHITCNPVLTNWLDQPSRVTARERSELRRIKEARQLLDECEAANRADGDARVDEVVRRAREVLGAWERSIELRLAELDARR